MTAWLDPLAEPFEVIGESGHSVILVHGFTGTAAHMRPLADGLVASGHTVVVPSLPGHGTEMSDLLNVTRAMWQASVDHAILRAEDLAERVHLVGFGLGAMLCMLAADERFVSLSLINPLTWFADKGIFLAPALSYVSRNQYWPEYRPALAPELRRFDIGYRGYPTKAIKQVLEARAAAFTAAQWIEHPTLIVQSRKDEYIVPDGAYDLRDRLVRTRVDIKWLENSSHRAVVGNELDELIDVVSGHIETA